MSSHPMDFLREEFLEPMGVTQIQLQEQLDLSAKTISELYQHKRGFTVTTAKKFGKLLTVSPEQLLQMQALYDLNNNKDDFDIKPLNVSPNTKSLLHLLNKGSYHEYGIKDLRDLFREDSYKEHTPLLVLLFENVPLSKTVKYMSDMNIGLSHLKKMYTFYLERLDGRASKLFERLLLDDDNTAVVKMCDNKPYFDDSREFEQYLFYRLRFIHKKKLLLDLSKDSDQAYEVRQRASYLYSFVTGKNIKLDFKPKPIPLYGKAKRVVQNDQNKYGLVSTIDLNRYRQFLSTGTY